MTNDRHERNEDHEAPTRATRAESVGDASAPPHDELDSLLRAWHDESAATARAHRDELIARAAGRSPAGAALRHPAAWRDRLHRIGTAPSLRAAALLAVAVLAGALMLLVPSRTASADIGVVQVPEGGRLDAVDRDGNLIGPCPLQHTAVDAQIAGFISRVTVTQKYANTYGRPIEAVYTFPLSHRAAVDRMRMIVRANGEERIVEGEMKERTLARRIYEAARRDGFVASLLEQERPNIFTQSVANIEPGAEVLVEISYVETLAMRDGVFTFDFPMVVGPRYIPGGSPQPPSLGGMPAGLVRRQGVVLLAPAQVRLHEQREDGSLTAQRILESLDRAVAIEVPQSVLARGAAGVAPEQFSARFIVKYPDGSEEPGTLLVDGTGEVAGRWFWCPPAPPEPRRDAERGTGFAKGTDQVPDAGLITPMPVRPPERAGHDLSLRIAIDTGGPAVTNLRSELHKVDVSEPTQSRAVVTLDGGKTIPNRDFVLSWSLAGGEMAEGVLTQHVPGKDGYFLLYLVPPARVPTETVRPRELIFVLDTSGSMRGFPIEKSKEVMTRMLGAMRPSDTFNLITFAGDHHVLWPTPRPATEENLKLARDFVESRKGRGGTEMMQAIDAALKPGHHAVPLRPRGDDPGWVPVRDPSASAPASSAAPPPATVPPTRFVCFLTDGYVGNDLAIVDAVRKYAGTTRVFSFGIGNSVNRFLLAEMAAAGRGAADFVLLPSDADEVVTRFTERVRTPVLTDISLSFDGVQAAHVTPPADAIPDLFDREPLVIAGRYPTAGRGSIRIRGMTGQGPWERTIPVDFTDGEGNSTVVASLWARRQVDDILRPHLNELQNGSVPTPIRDMVVRLSEQHRIMSPFTSFVAVEKTRVTYGGQSVLVAVPVELPQGVSWECNFGSAGEVLKALRAPATMADRDGDGVDESRLYFGIDSVGLQNDLAVSTPSSTLGLKQTGLGERSNFVGAVSAPASAPAPASEPSSPIVVGQTLATAEPPPPPSSPPALRAGEAKPDATVRRMRVDPAPKPAPAPPVGGIVGSLEGRRRAGSDGSAAPESERVSSTVGSGIQGTRGGGMGGGGAGYGGGAATGSTGSTAAPTDSGRTQAESYGDPRQAGRASNERKEEVAPDRLAKERRSGAEDKKVLADELRTREAMEHSPQAPKDAPSDRVDAFGDERRLVDAGAQREGVAALERELDATTRRAIDRYLERDAGASNWAGDESSARLRVVDLSILREQAPVSETAVEKRADAPSPSAGDRFIAALGDAIEPGSWCHQGGDAGCMWRLGDDRVIVAHAPDVLVRVDAFTAGWIESERESAAPEGGYTRTQLERLGARLEASLLLSGFEALAAKELAETDAGPGAASATAASTDPVPTGASADAPRGLAAETGPVTVVARFSAVDAALLKRLGELGIVVESRASLPEVVILRVPRERLVELGLLPTTVRVDPMPEEVHAAK